LNNKYTHFDDAIFHINKEITTMYCNACLSF